MKLLKYLIFPFLALAVSFGQSQTVKIGPNTVHVTARHCQAYTSYAACEADPSTLYYNYENHNAKTNSGVDFISAQLSGTSSTNVANYIALSTDSTAVQATDTTLPGEIVAANGLQRALGSYAHTASTNTYTVTKQFTATAAQSGIWKTGVLTQASGGTLVYEILLGASISMNNGDTLQVVWTVTIS